MVAGLSHITLIVADLDRSETFLVEGLGARKIYDSGSAQFSVSEERFFLLGESDIWIVIMAGDPLTARSYNHIAFKIAPDQIESYRSRLEAIGVEIEPGRSRVEGEGASLYFHDFDNHLFELHTGTLETRLDRYRSAPPFESHSKEGPLTP